MVKKTILACLLILLLSVPSFAIGTGVYDYAGLLSAEEEANITSIVESMQSAHHVDVLVLTVNDANGQSAREVADYFILSEVGTDQDALLLLIDMDNREVYFSTSGQVIDVMTDARIELALDAVFDNGLSAGDYARAITAGLSKVNTYLEAGVPSDGYREEESAPNTLSTGEAAAGIAGGGTLGVSHFLNNRKKYRTKTRPKPFALASNSLINLGAAAGTDRLLDTRTTSRIIPVVKPKSSSSSSGGGGRSTTHSTGGGTFGGGGRKF